MCSLPQKIAITETDSDNSKQKRDSFIKTIAVDYQLNAEKGERKKSIEIPNQLIVLFIKQSCALKQNKTTIKRKETKHLSLA